MKTYTILFLLFFSLEISAQVNPFSSSASNSSLMYNTENKVMLLPRMSSTEMNNIILNDVYDKGYMIYNTVDRWVYMSDNSYSWKRLVGDNVGTGVADQDLNVRNFNITSSSGTENISLDDNTITLQNFSYIFDRLSAVFRIENNSNRSTLWSTDLSVSKHNAQEDIFTNGWGILRSKTNSIETSMIRMNVRLNNTVFATIIAAPRTVNNNRYVFAIGNNFDILVYNTGTSPDPTVGGSNNLNTGIVHHNLRVTSDRRVKHVLAPIEEVLDRVAKMELVEFKYKEEVAHLGMSKAPLRIGFIAQDVIQLFPRYTHTLSRYAPETDRYSLFYKLFGVLALKSIQEFKERNDKEIYDIESQMEEKIQEEKITQLESKIEMFNQKVKDLESKLHYLNKKLGRE